MRKFISEYILTGLEFTLGIIGLALFMTIVSNTELIDALNYDNSEEGMVLDTKYEKIKDEDFIVNNAIVEYGADFNYLDYVEVKNDNGDDIKNYVAVLNEIDTKNIGENEVKYVLRYNGQTIYKTGYCYVLESDDGL